MHKCCEKFDFWDYIELEMEGCRSDSHVAGWMVAFRDVVGLTQSPQLKRVRTTIFMFQGELGYREKLSDSS